MRLYAKNQYDLGEYSWYKSEMIKILTSMIIDYMNLNDDFRDSVKVSEYSAIGDSIGKYNKSGFIEIQIPLFHKNTYYNIFRYLPNSIHLIMDRSRVLCRTIKSKNSYDVEYVMFIGKRFKIKLGKCFVYTNWIKEDPYDYDD